MTKGRGVVDRDGGQVNNRPQISPLRCAPVEMTKGRAALPATVVAEQDPFFIALGGPKAHDSPVEVTKGRTALPATVVAEQDPDFLLRAAREVHVCGSP